MCDRMIDCVHNVPDGDDMDVCIAPQGVDNVSPFVFVSATFVVEVR